MCFIFLQFSKANAGLLFLFKYCLLIAASIKIRFFTQTLSEKPEEIDYIGNTNDFVVNSIIEVVLVGLSANALLQRWLLEGDITRLSESWEEDELEDGSSAESSQEQGDEEFIHEESGSMSSSSLV